MKIDAESTDRNDLNEIKEAAESRLDANADKSQIVYIRSLERLYRDGVRNRKQITTGT